MITVNVNKVLEVAFDTMMYVFAAVFVFFATMFALMGITVYIGYNLLVIFIGMLFHIKDYICSFVKWVIQLNSKISKMTKGFKVAFAMQFIAALVIMLVLIIANAEAVILYSFAVLILLGCGAYLYWLDAMLE